MRLVSSSKTLSPLALYGSWAIAIASLLGSLYFSEIKHYVPCTLCWWQRIFMYPIVPLVAVGIVRKDKGLPAYVLPLSVTGMFVALYQNFLIWGIVPEKIAPCALGVSCTATYIEWFGFVSIPFLSLLAFVAITVCMAYLTRVSKHHE